MAVSTHLSSSYEFIKSALLSTIFPVETYVKDFLFTRADSSEVRPGLANLEIYRKLQLDCEQYERSRTTSWGMDGRRIKY